MVGFTEERSRVSSSVSLQATHVPLQKLSH